MTRRKPRFWILDGKEVVGTDNVLEWAKMFEEGKRIVRQEDLKPMEKDGLLSPFSWFDCRVSTVFLGLDHSFRGEGPPDIFETMIFGGPLDQETRRYSTWDDAEIGHLEMVWMAQSLSAMAREARFKISDWFMAPVRHWRWRKLRRAA